MGRNGLCFALVKDSLSKMIKKPYSKHFVSFIFKTSKTLKVKILHSTIAEINKETVKKYSTAKLL